MNIFYRSTISVVALAMTTFNVSAQVAEGKQTVALLEFEGRGISQLEAKTLTDRLMSEMVNTDAVACFWGVVFDSKGKDCHGVICHTGLL